MCSRLPALEPIVPGCHCTLSDSVPGLWASLAFRGLAVQLNPDKLSRLEADEPGCLLGGSLVLRAESSAEHLAQAVLARGAEVQVVRDGRDHQAAIHAGAAYPLNRPEPVSHGPLQVWTVVVGRTAFLPGHGLNLQHHDGLRTDSEHIVLPGTQYIKERAMSSQNTWDHRIRAPDHRFPSGSKAGYPSEHHQSPSDAWPAVPPPP